MKKKFDYIKAGDSAVLLKTIQAKSVDMVLTSPPYNAAHNYDNYSDNVSKKQYEVFLNNILKQAFRILKDDGRLCLNVPFAIKNMKTKNVFFIAAIVSNIAYKIGFKSFEFICWHKGKSKTHFQGNNTAWGSWKSPSLPNFRPIGEAVLIFYKKQKKHVGLKKNIDISSDEFKDWTKNMWYFDDTNSNVLFCSNNANKRIHPAPYPDELVKRILKLYTYQNDIVVDPFNGIGTTTYVCRQLKRHYIGFDLSKQYCKIAEERIKNVKKK